MAAIRMPVSKWACICHTPMTRLLSPQVRHRGASLVKARSGQVGRGPRAQVRGSARSLLTAERVALNFLQRMSGIATATRAMVDAVQVCAPWCTAANPPTMSSIVCMRRPVHAKARVRAPHRSVMPCMQECLAVRLWKLPSMSSAQAPTASGKHARSLTRRLRVRMRQGTGARIIETRKTAPGLRLLDKWAVLAGGGANHRIGLFDMVMIKNNHVDAAGGVAPAIRACMVRPVPCCMPLTLAGRAHAALRRESCMLRHQRRQVTHFAHTA